MRIQSTLKTNLVILACMITALFLSTGYAQTSPENLVRLWIKQSLRVDTFRITWVEGHEIKGKDGQIMGAFDLRQTCEYRWPIEMRIETRAIPTGHRHDSARAMQFDRESKIDASGEQTEAPLRSSNSRSLGTDRSLKGGVQYQALRAPHLIGIWLADHQEITSTAQRNADKTVSFTIEPLRLRVMLSENPDTSGNLHPVVSRLEFLDEDLYTLMWWIYDDFRPIENTGLWSGQFRIQYSESTGTLYESPPARVEAFEILPKRPANPSPASPASPASGSTNNAGTASSDGAGGPDSASNSTQQAANEHNGKGSKKKPMILIVLGLLGVGIVAAVLVLRSKQ